MKAFEIHIFREGKWKIDSVFDDRELAIFDAERMYAGGRYSGIRVIEEIFDENTGETRTRTVFKGAASDDNNAKSIKSQTGVHKNAMADRKQRTITKTVRRKQTKKLAKQKQTQIGLLKILSILAALVLGGIGILVGLRYFQDFL